VTAAALIALVVSLVFAATAPGLGRRLPPALATRTLVIGSVAVTASTIFVLAVVAFTWIGQLPGVAALGPWSSSALHHDSPIPADVAVGSGLLLALLGALTIRGVTRRGRALLEVHRTCRHLPGHRSLVVVKTDHLDAFTTLEPRGRIVVTTGLLDALEPVERRVVLAHETSHLRHRHPWWVLAADLAAVINPLLMATARTVAHCTERWADEDAAASVAERPQAARALARTALLMHRHGAARSSGALGVMTADVPGRVQALLEPPPRRRPAAVAALVGLVLVCALAAGAVQHLGERLFEHAGVEASSQHPVSTDTGASGQLSHPGIGLFSAQRPTLNPQWITWTPTSSARPVRAVQGAGDRPVAPASS
jgi:Zn-dependent protease with chaperone function